MGPNARPVGDRPGRWLAPPHRGLPAAGARLPAAGVGCHRGGAAGVWLVGSLRQRSSRYRHSTSETQDPVRALLILGSYWAAAALAVICPERTAPSRSS